MAVNKRLIFWLFKAYITKWRKTIFLFFLLGLGFFFILKFVILSYISKIPVVHKEIIGSVGAYSIKNLPSFVLNDLSHGLTSVDEKGQPHPDLATSWEIKDNGKAYIFHLKHNLTFVDGTPFTSKEINLAFSDVTIQKPNDYTIVFRLKETYSPFLVSMSRPIFKNGFTGIGKYELKDIKLNGTFVASLTTVDSNDPLQVRQYQFYPTEEALKIAFVVGNVTKIIDLTDITFKNTSFTQFPNANIEKHIDYSQLVTLFYNTQDKVLSDKKFRDALSYALPDTIAQGERSASSIPPQSWAYRENSLRTQDFEHATILLKDIKTQYDNKLPTLSIFTLPDYKPLSEIIATEWKKIGIQTKIKVVTNVPDQYQIFLGKFNVPQDPDQYSLWHSDQNNNIMNYKDIRIDKLLEDGRKTLDQNQRFKLYDDFQKYLADDQPASFLYFPYVYSVSRR